MSYGPFASSALAGQSLARTSVGKSDLCYASLTVSQGNLLGTAFPLFTEQMFESLGYRWANTIFGCLAALMIPIPFVRFN